MAEIISISNQKGGCGKTTTAVNLSAGLALLGKRVLLVDMDPQGNASMTFGINIEDIPISMADMLVDPELEMKYNIFRKGEIHIAPSNPTLNYAEERLHTMKDKVLRLGERLREVEGHYDYIIIDCPPSIGILTTNALMSSRWVIVPVDIGFYSMVGIRQLLARIEEIREFSGRAYGSPRPEILGFLMTMIDRSEPLSQQVLDKVRRSFRDKVFNSTIRRDMRLAEAPSHLKSIYEYEWDGDAAMDYLRLAREVIGKTIQGTSGTI